MPEKCCKNSKGDLYQFDYEIKSESGNFIVGVDEAGRGPLAGPVVAAAVVLDYEQKIEKIDDSKKLNQKTREYLYDQITEKAPFWSVGIATVEEIDKNNVLNATFLAMKKAIENIECKWSIALIDGNHAIPFFDIKKQKTLIGGDGKSASIAAASIVAKVTRDRMMKDYHDLYPHYKFDTNKGYGTKEHISKIESYGLSPIHRRTFCNHFFIQTKLDL
ncbi:ribonuclease HII [Chitinispirillales bacterium ANBcel5]|uniref:ribonuclease HII n=1 Tax=Cellulosispirillum alkaliphilum TaxID=3039283 RepID=UPI002A558699|nr:ribonuclease HII [Chitinispirillales bacterium ANBcel5]